MSSWHKTEPGPHPSIPRDSLLRESSALEALQRSGIAALLRDPSRVRFLGGVSMPDQSCILAAASYRRFARESIVTYQEDPAEHLFLIVKGSARHFFVTPAGRKINLLWLAPGDVFGGVSLLAEPAKFLVCTEIAKESSVLVWERDTIRGLAARCPKLLENALAIAAEYLTWYLASHVGLVCHTARQRLANVLVSLASGLGKKCSDGVQLDITNEQLANTANITLFTVSRLLSEWHRSGAVTKSRGSVLLRSPQLLFLA